MDKLKDYDVRKFHEEFSAMWEQEINHFQKKYIELCIAAVNFHLEIWEEPEIWDEEEPDAVDCCELSAIATIKEIENISKEGLS